MSWMSPAAPGSGAAPLHLQIRSALRDAIGRGELVIGDRLPPERELATSFGVSRMTLRHALEVLARDGSIERRPGRAGGTFVTPVHVELAGPPSLAAQLRGLGRRTGARVVEAAARPATGDERATLGTSSVYAIRRLRFATGQVFALERARFPTEHLPGLLDYPLAGSLHGLLCDEFDLAPLRLSERLEAATVREDEAPLLELEIGAPVLLVRRVSYAPGGQAVELAHELYRLDRTRIISESVIGADR
jgi:GntR family transcriptional regulator